MTMRTILERRLLRLCILVLACRFDKSVALPMDNPTKFTLSTGDRSTIGPSTENAVVDSRSRVDQGYELLGRFADAIRIGTGRFVNSVTLARNIIIDQAEAQASHLQSNVVQADAGNSRVLGQAQSVTQTTTQYPPVTNTRPNARESVRLENENAQSLLEKPVPKPFSGVLQSFLNPTPIVDGIREEDKYGNTGDKFIGIGRTLVNSFEGLSNILNAIVDFPRKAARSTSRGISETLNQVGARLVGLQ